MKNVLAVLCLALVPVTLTAQKSSIITETVTVRYLRMPQHPPGPEYLSYTPQVKVSTHELQGTGLTEWQLIDTYIRLDGYHRLPKDGDMLITATIGTLTTPIEKLKSRKTTTLDSEGREKILHEFYMEVKYIVPLSVTISGKNGSILAEKTIFDISDGLTHTTGYYKMDTELDAYWRSQKATKLAELKKQRILDGMAIMKEWMNDQLGYVAVEENIKLEMLGHKKSPEYPEYARAFEEIKTAFHLMKADKSLDDVKSKCKSALAFFEQNAIQYSLTDKEEQKLKHICLFNLATVAYWLEEFTAAEDYARQLLSMDPKDRGALQLISKIEETRRSLLKAGKSSRHQTI